MNNKGNNRSGQAVRLCSGQAMLITVIALGGTLLGATTIAGLLMLHQIRQATDLRDSNKAIFAADAGLEMARYYLRFEDEPLDFSMALPNGAKIDKIVCYSDLDATVQTECVRGDGLPPVRTTRSYDQAGRANRALEE